MLTSSTDKAEMWGREITKTKGKMLYKMRRAKFEEWETGKPNTSKKPVV